MTSNQKIPLTHSVAVILLQRMGSTGNQMRQVIYYKNALI